MFRALLRNAARTARTASASGAAGAAYAAGRSYATLFQKLGSNPEAVGFAAASVAAFSLGGVAFASSPLERSFIMIKPDGVHRGLIGDIIQRFERKGYKLVGIKVLVPSKDLAKLHYLEHAERPFFPKLVDFLSSGAVIAMVWEGKEAVKYGRTMIGATNPLASHPGTIRGDYGVDVGRNLIHGSDSTESAQREIALWFKPEELAEYGVCAKAWLYE